MEKFVCLSPNRVHKSVITAIVFNAQYPEKFNFRGKFTTDRHIHREYSPISAISVRAAPKSMLFEPFWSENEYRL